jgi:glycosyltransferase involved in cell wall biosynthesis
MAASFCLASGLRRSPADTPLVSVVIRTIGRASLQRSLDSVASQTYRPLEIVIVRARSDALRFAAPLVDDVRVVGNGSLDRPQAANAGLDAARGEWLVFLDDDDRFERDHLQSLIECARGDGDARVAYSATAGVDADESPVTYLRTPFNRQELFRQNYIQIGAALFHRSLVRMGCRFDESLALLQDWDFWIQLAQRTHFAFSGKATNVWFFTQGDSGSGAGANRNPELVNEYGNRIVHKWELERETLERKLAHHWMMIQRARAAGRGDRAQAHEGAVLRLLHGSPHPAPQPI